MITRVGFDCWRAPREIAQLDRCAAIQYSPTAD